MSPTTEDARPLSTRVQEATACCATIARELGLSDLAARVEAETDRRLLHQRIRVLVLGEINHGKSTLINALIGASILPMGVMPTTSAIVSVRQGSELELWAHRVDQPAQALDTAMLDDVVRGKVTVQGAWRYELASPDFALPPAVEVVDTPGFNDLSRFRSLLSAGELPHADVYLLVLDGTQALTGTEHDLVARALEAAGGFARSGAQLWVALNRADLLPSADDRAAVQGRVRARLLEVGIEPQLIVFCAAKSVLRDPKLEQTVDGIGEIRERLREVSERRVEILPQRARGEIWSHIRYLQTLADVHMRALRLDNEEQRTQIERVRERLNSSSAALTQLREQVDSRIAALVIEAGDTLAKLEREVQEEILGSIDRLDMQQLVGYLPGAARELIVERCAQASLGLKEQLEMLAQAVMAASSDLAARQLADARAALRVETAPLFVASSSLGIDVMSVVLGIVGTVMMSTSHVPLGIVMTIAAPLANFGLREKAVRDARQRVRSAVPSAVHDSLQSTQTMWVAALQAVAQRLREALTLGHAQLHTELLQTLQAAQASLESDGRQVALAAAHTRLQALAHLEFDLRDPQA